MEQTGKQTNVKEIKDFFGMSLTEMKAEWVKGGLTAQDREDIARGIGNGSLTYPDRNQAEPEAA